ncbi:MAG: glycosyltransferase family 2 protein [Lachnospiraceae bacterium]|nr:glycosyltransferase family 2 protein [Lachnospiraceae bacterium]
MNTVDIVVPCFNEAEGLELFLLETLKVTETLQKYSFRFIFVNDGSKDNTLAVMTDLAKRFPRISYLSFSRNFGKEAAMYAGLQASTADYVIIMDADLQHPPELIPKMAASLEAGHDCCAAMRTSRKGESRIRSLFSRSFYHISNRLTNVSLAYGAVDYRMMTRQMVDAILKLCEIERFSKGIFAWVGFDTDWIPYENVERTIGTSKWSFHSLSRYAIDGITSFSVVPLRMLSVVGAVISLTAFVYILITLAQTLIYGIDVPGYASTLCAVLFLGGVIELSIGIVGEYISHIYMETKHRPIYLLKECRMNTSDSITTGETVSKETTSEESSSDARDCSAVSAFGEDSSH